MVGIRARNRSAHGRKREIAYENRRFSSARSFLEHREKLRQLGVESFEIRQRKDLEQPCQGVILPGGESTVMGKLLNELDIMEPLRQKILSGLPVFGTWCRLAAAG